MGLFDFALITYPLQRIQELKWFIPVGLLALMALLYMARNFNPPPINGSYTAVRPGNFADEDPNVKHGTVTVQAIDKRKYEVAHTLLGDFGLQFTSESGGIVDRHHAYKTFSFHRGRQALTLRTVGDKELVLHRMHATGVDVPQKN